uniref:Amine oxidase domain-containing protein n=1 Tax=Plectus sambesii TaxID=2011161 RepID=A0A914W0J8_9BILA
METAKVNIALLFLFAVTENMQLAAAIPSRATNSKNSSIAIIGAGVAGLAAASRLIELGFTDVTIFEAQNRIGGRVFPVPFESGYLQMGAEYINGRNNPIYKIAQSLNILDKEENDAMDSYDPLKDATFYSGNCALAQSSIEKFLKFIARLEKKFTKRATEGDEADKAESIGHLYGEEYKKFAAEHAKLPKDKDVYDAMSHFYQAYYEAEWAADWNDLSLINFAQDNCSDPVDPVQIMNKQGYKAVLDHISANIPSSSIKLNSKVASIDYSGSGIRINLTSGPQKKKFQKVIVTVSLGHLKKFAKTLFHPSLPQAKQKAINELGFGAIGKLFLVYKNPWWDPEMTSLVTVAVESCANSTAADKLFHTFEPIPWSKNVLLGWLSGPGPAAIDAMSDDKVSTTVTSLFRRMLKNSTIPAPTKIFRNQWTTNPLFGGTYSYISVAAAKTGLSLNDQLAAPIVVDGVARVLFAGEATHEDVYATVIGAYSSGRREAERLAKK